MAEDETPTAAANVEVELKLGGSVKDLRAFEAAVGRLAGGNARWQRETLRSRYFDTPDLGLHGQGAALRLRRNGSGWVQTVKAKRGGRGAAHARAEWEQPVDGGEPDLDALPADARKRLGLSADAALRPVVDVDVVRRRAVIRRSRAGGGEAAIEAVVDEGAVTADGKRQPIAECELELLQGEPADLYDAALELCRGTRLRIVTDTKSGRGYDMLLGRVPAPEKAAKVDLDPTMTASDALAEILGAALRSALRNEQPAYDGRDPEGVHQFRVAVRRMRSALSVFSTLLDEERFAWLQEELKWLMASLGPARDWDVFLGETLAGVDGTGIDEAALGELAVAARDMRRTSYHRVRRTLRSPRYTRLLLGLSAFIENRGWEARPLPEDHPLRGSIGDAAAMLLERAYRKVKKLGKRLDGLDVEARHELRIRLKKLRYATDFLQGLYPERTTSPFLRRLAQLQDQFGYLNDVAVARHLVEEAMARAEAAPEAQRRLATAAGLVVGWHARGLHDKEATLMDDWKAFAKAKPFWQT